MKVKKQWIFIALIVVVIFGMVSYFGTLKSETAELTITTEPQPAKIGYANIEVASTLPLESVFVILSDRSAVFDHQDGNTYHFNYFVSPYDEIGPKQITVTAVDSNGHQLISDNNSLYVGYNAPGVVYNDVIFYSYEWEPTLKTLELFREGKVNVFFESKPGVENDLDFLQAFIDLIIEITSRGTEVVIFDVGVENGEWIDCMDSNSTMIPVENCINAMDERPSVIMRYPDYPTTQVFISNRTIEVQPKLGEAHMVVDGMVELFAYVPPVFDLSVDTISDNSTSGV